MTRKQQLQLAVGGFCVIGALATLFGGITYGIVGLGCFLVAGVLLIPLLRMKE